MAAAALSHLACRSRRSRKCARNWLRKGPRVVAGSAYGEAAGESKTYVALRAPRAKAPIQAASAATRSSTIFSVKPQSTWGPRWMQGSSISLPSNG